MAWQCFNKRFIDDTSEKDPTEMFIEPHKFEGTEVMMISFVL